jgi:hypothetical protein
VQLFGDNPASTRKRAWIAVSKAGPIVGADARELCNLRLHLAPGKESIAEPGVENHGGISISCAVNIHLETANIKSFAGIRIEAAVASLGNVFVEGSCNREKRDEQTADDKDAPENRVR